MTFNIPPEPSTSSRAGLQRLTSNTVRTQENQWETIISLGSSMNKNNITEDINTSKFSVSSLTHNEYV